MKPKYYTKTGQHPDDAIIKVKSFINELQKVQEKYFNDLVNDLNLKENNSSNVINDFLFDYIYNEDEDIESTFTEYLANTGKDYEDFVN
jgi:hypothetical protein